MPTTSPPSSRRRRLLVALTFVLAVATGIVPAAAQDPGPAGEDSGVVLKERYDEVLGAEADLIVQIDASARRSAALAVRVADLNRQIDRKTSELAASDRLLDTAEAEDERARTALAAAARRLAAATEELHTQAVASYIRGGGTDDAVTTAVRAYENGDAVGRSRSYADAVLTHQRDVIIEFKAARVERDRLSQTAATARTRATRARDSIADARSALATAKLDTQTLTDKAARELYFQQITLNGLLGKKLEIEARIVGLEKESDGIGLALAGLQLTQPPFEAGAVEFANPLPGLKIGSPFGMRFHPILHYTRLHAGADFGAASGTPIYAAADGVVVVAGNRGGYGNCTVIDHGFGVATVYAHQSSIGVQVGQTVKRGDPVGRVGTTGLSTGPHLHFETRLHGVPVNPTNFITF